MATHIPFKNRIGETNYNKYGSKMKIIEYINYSNVVVEFDNGYITKCRYSSFKNHKTNSPYDKSIYGVGYLGEGAYKSAINKINTIQYHYWTLMLKRCYNDKLQEKYPTYKNCSVCDEWLNFQNFAQWFDENYYEVDGNKMDLDKDILYKGNKIYSPNTCVLVPQYINTLFCKRQNDRGEYPIGVNIHKNTGHFEARCSTLEGRIYLGVYNTPKEAYYVYKRFKEKYIKEIADKYKDKIPKKLYDAMYIYEVDIDD